MTRMRQACLSCCLLACIGAVVTVCPHAYGDEGMWLFNDLPKKQLKEKYQFEPTEAWSEHVMRSSVRFNSGGSASFVSSTAWF